MAKTPSTMLELGTEAPDFALPDTEGNVVRRDDYADHRGLVVAFLCNHCPFVKHIREGLARVSRELIDRGIGVVGINANDVSKYPDDAPERMKEEKAGAGYPFPYLFDESQEVAKAYRAACTPDFFLFDADLRLFYRGQLDDSRPGNDQPVDGASLKAAAEALRAGEEPPAEQKPSLGCNIKWKPGNEPDYFG